MFQNLLKKRINNWFWQWSFIFCFYACCFTAAVEFTQTNQLCQDKSYTGYFIESSRYSEALNFNTHVHCSWQVLSYKEAHHVFYRDVSLKMILRCVGKRSLPCTTKVKKKLYFVCETAVFAYFIILIKSFFFFESSLHMLGFISPKHSCCARLLIIRDTL